MLLVTKRRLLNNTIAHARTHKHTKLTPVAESAQKMKAAPKPTAGQYTDSWMKHGTARRKMAPEMMQYNSQQ